MLNKAYLKKRAQGTEADPPVPVKKYKYGGSVKFASGSKGKETVEIVDDPSPEKTPTPASGKAPAAAPAPTPAAHTPAPPAPLNITLVAPDPGAGPVGQAPAPTNFESASTAARRVQGAIHAADVKRLAGIGSPLLGKEICQDLMKAATRALVLVERSMNFEKAFVEQKNISDQYKGERSAVLGKLKEAEEARDAAQAKIQILKADQARLKSDLEKERGQKEASWQKLASEKAALKAAQEHIAAFPGQLQEAVQKAEQEYMSGPICQTAFADIYMEGFNEAKTLVGQVYPDLDLSGIDPAVPEETASQAVSKGRGQELEGSEKDEAESSVKP